MKVLFFLVKLAITITVLYFALRHVSINEYKQAFSLLTPTVFLFLVSTVILQVLILAYRWSYLMVLTAKAKMSLADAFVGILMSFFFSQGLPASIGGDAFRVWWITKRGVTSNSAIKIVFFDRVYGLIALTIACIGSILYFFMLKREAGTQVISLAVAILLAGSLLWLLVMPFRLGVSQFLMKATAHLPSWLTGIVHWGVQARDSLSRRDGSQTFILVGSSLLTHCMVVLQAYTMGHILCPEKLNILVCILAVPPALFVSYMPFSIAGWGVREASMVMAFGLFGIPAATAVIISLTIGMAVLVTSLLGGAFWVLGYRKSHSQDLVYLNKEEVL